MGDKRKNATGMHIGSATLVLVFAVLCLSIFAALSVVTANNEYRLAEKNAQAVTNYYVADGVATEIFREISAQYDGAFTVPPEVDGQLEGDSRLSYWVPIDDNQQLWVQLEDNQGHVTVARWEVEEKGTWIADDTLNVWGG